MPLGYFSQNRLGELTATLTTTLGEIETNAVAILDKVANGFVHAVAITLLISWYDWHAGLITAAGLVVSLFVYGAMQRKAGSSPRYARRRSRGWWRRFWNMFRVWPW